MELILLRHAAAPGNLLHQYIGRTDQPLASEGIAQAKALAGRLPIPELLFVSPLQRCRQTAALVWPNTAQLIVPELRETDFGLFEEKTWEELKDDSRYRAWIDGVADCPQGESREAVSARIRRGGEFCLHWATKQKSRCCAIVAHGGTIMELLLQHCGGDRYAWQPPLCGGWQVEISEDGGWKNPMGLEEMG